MIRFKVNLNEKGFSLVEVLVSIAILGVLIPSFVLGMSTAAKTLTMTDERQTAKNLAESQMEYVMNLNYNTTYNPAPNTMYTAPISSDYAGYYSNITVENITSRNIADIQKIRITISHQGKQILLASNSTLEDYKVKR